MRARAGEAGGSGPPEEQPDWDAHEAFIDDLVDRGLMVMGGPFSDFGGSMMLFEGIGAGEVAELLKRDPFVVDGVFVVEDVREWTVYVDTLSS